MQRTILSLMVLSAAAGIASAQATIDFLPPGYLISDLSRDGSVAAGNVAGDGSYETFRWTAVGGVERLGRASVPVIGRGAGTPDISYDGTRVSASILSTDGYLTQGVWDVMTGWQETMPPLPPGAQPIDQSYGSAWGLSGDGGVVTGFFWSGGKAQPSKWSSATGMIALPKDAGRNARVNASSYDGSVVVGWEERSDGAWQPTAWRGLTKIRLTPTEAFDEANSVNADGSVIVGYTYDAAQATRGAAIWRWDGSAYQVQRLGFLPGTVLTQGMAALDSITDDGQIAVGFNRYTMSPGGPTDGIIWTPSAGLLKDTDFLASMGLTIPDGFDIIDFYAISPDGSTIAGTGRNSAGQYQTFLITLPPACRADINGDGLVDFADYLEFLNYYDVGDLTVDFNGDGLVDFADYLEFLNLYDAGC
ncbi:MAG: hypothetical protein IT436_11820 [Phycisphaerales bacterium]|nr:hypothetical protein [Phycisphaerales bacterium]